MINTNLPAASSHATLSIKSAMVFWRKRFQGYNDQVIMAFVWSFDGEHVQVRNLSFRVIEESMSRTIVLQAIGKQLFKGGQLYILNCAMFLKLAYMSISWAKGVLQNWIDKWWHPFLTMRQHFVTYEGIYIVVFLYHIHLMTHLQRIDSWIFPTFWN